MTARERLAREIADRACERWAAAQVARQRAEWCAATAASLARRRARLPRPRQERTADAVRRAAATLIRQRLEFVLVELDHAPRTMTPREQRVLARRAARRLARLHAWRMTA